MKLKLFFITILLTLILCSGIAVNAQTTTAVSIDSAVLNGTKLSLTLHSDTETTAYIYAAEYNNGILSSLKLQNAVLTAYSSVISFDNISSDTEVFILDKNLSPLCESFYVSNITGDGINGAGEQPDTAPYENPYTASDHSGLFTDTAVAAKTGPTMPGGHGGGQGGPNPGASEDVSYGYIKVDGGYIYINNTNGVGLDSNVNMIINDDVIIVDGATLGSEDGLDYDGNIELNGGFVFTMTAGGMDSITESFSQKYLTYGYSGRGGFGSSSSSSSISNGSYAICDSNGNILCAFSRTKGSIQRILLSLPQISSSETYYIRPLNVTGVSAVNSIFGVIDSYSKEFTVYDSCSLNTSGSKYTMTIK